MTPITHFLQETRCNGGTSARHQLQRCMATVGSDADHMEPTGMAHLPCVLVGDRGAPQQPQAGLQVRVVCPWRWRVGRMQRGTLGNHFAPQFAILCVVKLRRLAGSAGAVPAQTVSPDVSEFGGASSMKCSLNEWLP